MPYVITTTPKRSELRQLDYIAARGSDFSTRMLERADGVSRRAVATLDDVRDWFASAPLPDMSPQDAMNLADAGLRLPDSGGTVGPLPDGTVIEVARVQIGRLWDDALKADPELYTHTNWSPNAQDAAAAYNAAQEAGR